MARKIRFSIGPFLLYGAQVAALASTAIHPLMPLIMIVAGFASIFLFYFPQILLVLLANIAFIKRTLVVQFPIFEIFDPVVLLVTLTIIVIIWKTLLPDGRLQISANRVIIVAYLMWVVWMFAATTYAPSPEQAVLKWLEFALFNTILFIGPFALIRTRRESRVMLNIYLGIGLSVAILVIGQVLLQVVAALTLGGVTSRVSILSANPIGVGRFLAICTAISGILIISGESTARRWGLPLILFFAATILTGSRGPVVSLMAAILFMGLLLGGAARRKTLFFMALVSVFFGLILLVAPTGITYRYQLLIARGVTRTAHGLVVFNTVAHRVELWGLALAMWLKDVWHFFFGDGTAGYARLFPWREFKYPHNLPLEVLAEYGLLGASVFGLHLWLTAGKLFRRLRARVSREELMWSVALMTFFFSTLVSGDLINNRFLWFFMAGFLATVSAENVARTLTP